MRKIKGRITFEAGRRLSHQQIAAALGISKRANRRALVLDRYPRGTSVLCHARPTSQFHGSFREGLIRGLA